ncbi:hypothetical protein HHL08_04380 [Sphingobium sp. AR-3-1]|uniref:Uncharacterized protein n=1 Tax=Sphingobium psychrophilum TaxID=2728834 RepID=A0A7X9ZSM7_9SPHN|nr:hypothetical protein [Sphingobium psychrophilum]NML09384.1 hypothetical protein [Sphingobium psychrophilum]
MKRALRLLGVAALLSGCTTTPIAHAPTASADNCAPTAQFAFVCGANKPEDLAHIPATPWIIASGFAIGSGLKLVDSRTRRASLWFTAASDQVAPDPRYPDCATPPDPTLFTARGLSLRMTGPRQKQGQGRLLVVNHGGREAIEVFAIDARGEGAPTLRWQGCLAMPPGHVANAVASYTDGTVIATVLTRPGTSITDFVLGRITGGVYERSPQDSAFRLLPGTELPGNNGLETARDDSGFYVIAFGLRDVVAYARHDTRRRLWRAQAPEFMPDNIHWDGDRLLLAGMVRDEPACGGVRKIVNGVADGMLCHRGYAVAQLDPETRRFSLVAYGPPDPVFNGVSAAVMVDDDLWLGSYQADWIAVRQLPYTLP